MKKTRVVTCSSLLLAASLFLLGCNTPPSSSQVAPGEGTTTAVSGGTGGGTNTQAASTAAPTSATGATQAAPTGTSGGTQAAPTGAATPGGEETPTSAPPTASLTDTNLKLETITGLTQPTAIAFLGPDDLLVTEKTTGRVMRIQNRKIVGPVIDLATNGFDERGTLGITLHPQFANNKFVYIYWTCICKGTEPQSLLGANSDKAEDVPELGNRVDRFIWDGSKLTFDRNIVRLRSNTLTDTTGRVRGNHDAGVIVFGPDGKLYVIIGDQNLRGRLQNLTDAPATAANTLTGVILRLNDDGSTPSDNPFASQGDVLGKIYVYGIRNSFGMTFDPMSGSLWESENGDDAMDEINRFEAGDNSGWIQLMGSPERFKDWKDIESNTKDGFDNPDFPPSKLANDANAAQQRFLNLPGSHYRPPLFVWKYPNAVTAIGFIPNDALGADYKGDLLAGDVLSGSLYRFKLSQDRKSLALAGPLADGVADNKNKADVSETDSLIFGKTFGITTDIKFGPDNALWLASISSGSIYRISK